MGMKKILAVAALIAIVLIVILLAVRTVNVKNSPTAVGNLLRYGPGDYEFSLVHGGLDRKYLVHVPGSYDESKNASVVIALHGGGGNAADAPKYFGLNEKSDKEGFIVVYPEGIARTVFGRTLATWNAGRCCGLAMQKNVDDVGFMRAMLRKLKADFAVDGKRIYATGMSNGAQMAYRLACELSDEIAAIAPSGSQGTFDDCNPGRPVPVLHIQGKDDPCSLYEGGTCGGCMAEFWREMGIPVQDNDWECAPIPSYIDGWRTRNGCSEIANATFKNRGATCMTYGSCRQDADVILCVVEGMGHNWPGQTAYGVETCERSPNGRTCKIWRERVGPLSQDIVANDALWEFFKEHPMN